VCGQSRGFLLLGGGGKNTGKHAQQGLRGWRGGEEGGGGVGVGGGGGGGGGQYL